MSDKLITSNNELSDVFYMRLIEFLKERGLQPGDALPSEASLAAELAVGRPQLREALGVLEAFGMVEGRQGARRIWRGADFGESLSRIAAAFFIGSRDVTKEFVEVRHALETALLPVAATRLTAADLEELRGLALAMIAQAEAGHDFSDNDERFHRALFRGLDNTILDGVLQAFWTVFRLGHGHDHADAAASADREIAAMHLHVVDAIAANDAKRAVYELDAHFYGIRRRYPDPASTVPNTHA